MFPKKRYLQQSGTTIIEVLVATFILSVGLLSALSLSVDAHSKAGFSKEEIVAVNLAREAIEIVRNMRDNNWLQGAAWDEGIQGSGGQKGGVLNFDTATNKWELQHVADPPGALNDETSRLYFKNNFYTTESTGVKTNLKRIIEITDTGGGEKTLKATVRIEWKGLIRDVVVEDHLYNWR